MGEQQHEHGPWDHVARRLQEWRLAADEPSYSEIALRISRRREDDGTDPAAARVGRTTIYDAFRLGRSRVNIGLVREIAHALGVSDEAVDDLIAARRDAREPEAPPSPPAPSPLAPPSPSASIAPSPSEPTRLTGVRQAALLMLGCLLLNLLGREVVDLIKLPVYLDMAGTALAAIVLGPWRGAAVGLATNLLGVLISGPESLPFALVNVVGALVWGYGVHRFGLGRTLARFFALTLVAAAACTLTAVPILTWLYGGSVDHGQDALTAKVFALTHHEVLALWTGNLLTSVADKVMCAFVALVGASMLGTGLVGAAVPPIRVEPAHDGSGVLGDRHVQVP